MELGFGIWYDEQVICVVVAEWTFRKTSWRFRSMQIRILNPLCKVWENKKIDWLSMTLHFEQKKSVERYIFCAYKFSNRYIYEGIKIHKMIFKFQFRIVTRLDFFKTYHCALTLRKFIVHLNLFTLRERP